MKETWINRFAAQFWYQHGKRHRLDGPAEVRRLGTQRWYQNDDLHREDGPAVIWTDGLQHWFLGGVFLSEAQWKKRVNR